MVLGNCEHKDTPKFYIRQQLLDYKAAANYDDMIRYVGT